MARPVALITGASSGIGAATVLEFVRQGWAVYAAARRAEKLKELVQRAHELQKGEVWALTCDVDNDASVAQAIAQVQQKSGRLDALVNNAGFGVYGSVSSTPLKEFRANMETNYFGALRCVQAALPLLRAAGQQPTGHTRPAIINVSSIVGRRAFPGSAAYCASKFALEGLSESLRLELKKERISVSVVNPGLTNTNFFAAASGARPAGYLDPRQGAPVETVARAIFNCVRRPRRNVYLTAAGKTCLATQWLSPQLLDAVLWKHWSKAGGGQ